MLASRRASSFKRRLRFCELIQYNSKLIQWNGRISRLIFDGCKTRMAMVSTFFSHFIKPTFGLLTFSVATAVVVSIMAAPSAYAQEDSQQTESVEESTVEKKVIREPIHRVPKVARNNVPPRNIPPRNVAPNVKKSTPAFLPSATKPVPAPSMTPADPAPAPNPSVDPTPKNSVPALNPAASKSTIPVIPASNVKPVVPTRAPHPLDDALETAKRGLVNMRENIKDYSAIMVKRERVNGELLPAEYMQLKVRSEHVDQSGKQNPFGIYVKFIKPRACAGREVIWVKGRNDGKLSVHEGSGIVSLRTFHLDPESWLAMKGQRYPIYEAGMENLIVKLIEKAERDRAAGQCEVEYTTGVSIKGRECDVIKVTHAEEREPYDFHIAKVYIDKELKMPIRYEAHLWPESKNSKPKLLEQYTYLYVKVNQGFTDEDFSIENPAYSFP